jgi:peptidyl-prolyl cis-trans isomerase B (cyclophilin B)
MSQSRRPSRRVPPKGRSLRNDPRPDPFADGEFGAGGEGASTVETGSRALRPGSRAANRAAKRAVGGVRPKTQVRGGSGRRSSRSNTPLLLLAVAAIVVVAAVIALGNPFGSPAGSAAPSGDLAVGDGTCPTAQPAPLPAGQTRTVTITTPKGDIVLEIDGALSPIAAGNFVALVTCHFYDGSVFHRTASLQDGTPFVIQGGAAREGSGDISYTITDEPVTTPYKRGTLAMARTSAPNSQSSQFFIVLDDKAAPPLVSANTYAIFGSVISGMDVADAIFSASGGAETPSDPIPMTTVTVSSGPAATATTAPTAAPTTPATSPAASTAPTSAPTTIP